MVGSTLKVVIQPSAPLVAPLCAIATVLLSTLTIEFQAILELLLLLIKYSKSFSVIVEPSFEMVKVLMIPLLLLS